MTALAPGRAPRTDSEWAAEVSARLRALEQRNTVRVGPWVFSSQDEKLIASRPGATIDLDGAVAASDSASIDFSALRGFITEAQLDSAVSTAVDAGSTTTKNEVWQALLGEIADALNPDDALARLGDFLRNGLFGKIFPNRLGTVPLANINSGDFELLDNPIFDDAQSIAPNTEGWEWDGTVQYGGVGGSARIYADGMVHELYSNAIEDVVPKQKIPMLMRVRWQSLVSTGAPIQLVAVATRDGDQEVTRTIVDQILAPPAASADWIDLDGTYVVPETLVDGVTPALIDEVHMVLLVDATATAGVINFAGGSMRKTIGSGIAPIGWVQGLDNTLNTLDEFGQFIVMTVMKVLTGIPFVGWLFDDLETELGDWFDDTQDTAATANDNKFNLRDLMNGLVQGIKGGTPTGQTPAQAQAAVAGLNGRVIALEGGGFLTQYTANGTWTKPVNGSDGVPFGPDEIFTIVCICGGNGGGKPGTNAGPAPLGGLGGGYIEKQVKYRDLPATVAMTVGAPGAGSTATSSTQVVGGSGATTSFGSVVVGVKGGGGVYQVSGNRETAIPPGNGGRGYYATSNSATSNTQAERGMSGPFAVGGEPGAAGASAPSGVPSGGGGGGGGDTGDGGAGGFPGGGGGAGSFIASTRGNGGTGGSGSIYVTAPH